MFHDSMSLLVFAVLAAAGVILVDATLMPFVSGFSSLRVRVANGVLSAVALGSAALSICALWGGLTMDSDGGVYVVATAASALWLLDGYGDEPSPVAEALIAVVAVLSSVALAFYAEVALVPGTRFAWRADAWMATIGLLGGIHALARLGVGAEALVRWLDADVPAPWWRPLCRALWGVPGAAMMLFAAVGAISVLGPAEGCAAIALFALLNGWCALTAAAPRRRRTDDPVAAIPFAVVGLLGAAEGCLAVSVLGLGAASWPVFAVGALLGAARLLVAADIVRTRR
jgi:hypothetical protein